MDWSRLQFVEGRFANRQIARKAALTFNAAEIADTESLDVYAEWSSLLRALRPFDCGALFGLAAFGVALTARHWRRLWFLYAIGTTYALSVVVFYVFARYRFPLVPVLLVLAAGVVVQVFARLNDRTPERGGRVRLAVAAGAARRVSSFAEHPRSTDVFHRRGSEPLAQLLQIQAGRRHANVWRFEGL